MATQCPTEDAQPVPMGRAEFGRCQSHTSLETGLDQSNSWSFFRIEYLLKSQNKARSNQSQCAMSNGSALCTISLFWLLSFTCCAWLATRNSCKSTLPLSLTSKIHLGTYVNMASSAALFDSCVWAGGKLRKVGGTVDGEGKQGNQWRQGEGRGKRGQKRERWRKAMDQWEGEGEGASDGTKNRESDGNQRWKKLGVPCGFFFLSAFFITWRQDMTRWEVISACPCDNRHSFSTARRLPRR